MDRCDLPAATTRPNEHRASVTSYFCRKRVFLRRRRREYPFPDYLRAASAARNRAPALRRPRHGKTFASLTVSCVCRAVTFRRCGMGLFLLMRWERRVRWLFHCWRSAGLRLAPQLGLCQFHSSRSRMKFALFRGQPLKTPVRALPNFIRACRG